MLGRFALLVIFTLCALAGASSGRADAAGAATIVYRGSCTVAGGIRAQNGQPVKAWQFWQEIFLTGSPTWLAAHTHHGAECIMNVYGVTSWWFEHRTAAPNAPPTIVPVSPGRTVYTAQGRVHTAGSVEPSGQAYLGIHLLEQGSDFNYPASPVPVTAPSPVQKTSPVSIFKSHADDQVPSTGTVVIANRIVAFRPGDSYAVAASPALGYYTVVTGRATITVAGRPRPMLPGAMITLPRNAAARITAAVPTLVAATELVPAR